MGTVTNFSRWVYPSDEVKKLFFVFKELLKDSKFKLVGFVSESLGYATLLSIFRDWRQFYQVK